MAECIAGDSGGGAAAAVVKLTKDEIGCAGYVESTVLMNYCIVLSTERCASQHDSE